MKGVIVLYLQPNTTLKILVHEQGAELYQHLAAFPGGEVQQHIFEKKLLAMDIALVKSEIRFHENCNKWKHSDYIGIYLRTHFTLKTMG